MIDRWVIINDISKYIDFDNNEYFDKRPFPTHGDNDFYYCIDTMRFIYLQAIMGFGKTEHIMNIIKNNPDASFLIIVPRISLSISFEKEA